jgi:hypothetical protein
MVNLLHQHVWCILVNNCLEWSCFHTPSQLINHSLKAKLRGESARELYLRNDSRLSAKLMPTCADRNCHVVSLTDPYGRIQDFIDRSSYNFFQVAPQLCSRGWVDRVPDQLVIRKSGSAWNRTRASGSVVSARGPGSIPGLWLWLQSQRPGFCSL